MSDTRELLARITALRQRLEPIHGHDGPTEKSTGGGALDRLRQLEHQVTIGSAHDALLAVSFSQLPPVSEGPPLPAHRLTARARRLLEVGHGLIGQLREVATLLDVDAADLSDPIPEDPLVRRFRETLAMTDTALRGVLSYPDSPSVQLRLCEGLAGILNVVAEHTRVLRSAAEQRHRETGWVETLTELLTALHGDSPPPVAPFVTLAEAILNEAEQAGPLRFFQTEAVPLDESQSPQWLARMVACHGLTTGQVMARLVRYDPDLRGQMVEAVVAALVHDAGMLCLPPTLCAHAGVLDTEQRRRMETHTRQGAELVARLLAQSGWLAEAALYHHERHDGTGYPDGLRETQVPPLVRLLAVCDVYAAICAPRPHRPAREPRTALTDTLLLADKGALDRLYAERLLHLSFYPVGSIVELADGAVGLVVATHTGRRDVNTPARPVLVLLTTPQGEALPRPRPLDLAECEGRSIVRVLPAVERRQLLGQRYPELA